MEVLAFRLLLSGSVLTLFHVGLINLLLTGCLLTPCVAAIFSSVHSHVLCSCGRFLFVLHPPICLPPLCSPSLLSGLSYAVFK